MTRGAMYSAIGGIFEYLNSDCGYDEWSQYLIDRLSRLGKFREGYDVGCGSGRFTRALRKAGYTVRGVDISGESLAAAAELARKEGLDIPFILGDARTLRLPHRTDFVTAINDCFNYIPPAEIKGAFRSVYSCLKKGGAFIFDVSSEKKLRETVGSNTFVKDLEEATVIWFNTLKEDRVEMEITLFSRNAGGTYSRSDERQTQYIHTEESLVSALKETGFSVLTEGHLGGDKSERINFLCKKL